jgi:hypothetical protein
MKRTLSLLAFFVPPILLGSLFAQSSWDLRSPNNAIEIRIRTAGEGRPQRGTQCERLPNEKDFGDQIDEAENSSGRRWRMGSENSFAKMSSTRNRNVPKASMIGHNGADAQSAHFPQKQRGLSSIGRGHSDSHPYSDFS